MRSGCPRPVPGRTATARSTGSMVRSRVRRSRAARQGAGLGFWGLESRQWSAGAIVHLQAIRRLFADPGNRYVDFRPGDCEVKRQFANGALRSAVVLNLRRTLRNRLILAAYSLTRQLSAGREEAAVVPGAIRELLVFAG